jgi:hypothetical protein
VEATNDRMDITYVPMARGFVYLGLPAAHRMGMGGPIIASRLRGPLMRFPGQGLSLASRLPTRFRL